MKTPATPSLLPVAVAMALSVTPASAPAHPPITFYSPQDGSVVMDYLPSPEIIRDITVDLQKHRVLVTVEPELIKAFLTEGVATFIRAASIPEISEANPSVWKAVSEDFPMPVPISGTFDTDSGNRFRIPYHQPYHWEFITPNLLQISKGNQCAYSYLESTEKWPIVFHKTPGDYLAYLDEKRKKQREERD